MSELLEKIRQLRQEIENTQPEEGSIAEGLKEINLAINYQLESNQLLIEENNRLREENRELRNCINRLEDRVNSLEG